MPKFLLACACGRQLEVEPGQAGETLHCECGESVAIPALRQLRQLPPADAREPAAAASTWGARQGAIVVSLMIATVCLALAALSRFTEPELPQFDPVGSGRHIEHQIDNLTPVGAWEVWVRSYRRLATEGFTEFEHPATAALQQEIEQRRWLQAVLLAVAAVCGVAAGVLGVAKNLTFHFAP